MLSGGTASHSDFSSSEEDEVNGTDLTKTIQGTPSVLHIKDLIGRGAFGSVYRATWKGLPAAVKASTHQHCHIPCMQQVAHHLRVLLWLTCEGPSFHVACQTSKNALWSALNCSACMQVIEHGDEETHASFSPLSTGASLRSFPGTPLAAQCCDTFYPVSADALALSQGTSPPSPSFFPLSQSPLPAE